MLAGMIMLPHASGTMAQLLHVSDTGSYSMYLVTTHVYLRGPHRPTLTPRRVTDGRALTDPTLRLYRLTFASTSYKFKVVIKHTVLTTQVLPASRTVEPLPTLRLYTRPLLLLLLNLESFASPPVEQRDAAANVGGLVRAGVRPCDHRVGKLGLSDAA